ncbi:cation diffusion facilitator family transporter [Paenibacillus macerans]|uniref:cation diffusion facilitator family transporter n=1 Tax=Paenibacillus macerans TaxID=44252 RepID=UPI003D3165C5
MTREQAAMPVSAAWLSILNDVVLAVFKGAVGLLFDSRALLAGALYSASDAAAGVAFKLQWPGLKRVRREAPGSSRRETAEPLLAIFLSVFLLMGGLQLLIASITSIIQADIVPPETMTLVAVFISMALKEAMFQVRLRQSRKRDADDAGPLIESHRHSLFSSVAVLIGVFGAMGGQAWDIPAMLYLEPIAAILVACHVLLRAYFLVKGSLYGAIAAEMQEEDASSFIETVQRVHGVIAVDDLKAQENGHYVTVLAKISVNPKITVLEANDIANRAKMLLLNRFSHVIDVRIQVAPYDAGYPYKSNAEESGSDLPNLLQ